jgi:glyoxylase-like metal-dependent hydrolase (beta-lactamase superfamily II)
VTPVGRHSDSAYEVLAVRFGTRVTSRGDYYLAYGAYGEPDAPIRMDYFFWVVRGAEETILVDTGWDQEVAERRGRTPLVPPLHALAQLGVERDTISRIVLTHLHWDHVGNLDLFPEARLLVQERELEFWSGAIAERHQFRTHVEPADLARVQRAESEGRVHRLAGDAELAPGVQARLVGGHSPGQMILVVKTESGPVVVASDATHFYEELERDWPCVIVADLGEMYAAYDTLRALTTRDGARLLPGHDPEVLERFPRADGSAGEFAARLR